MRSPTPAGAKSCWPFGTLLGEAFIPTGRAPWDIAGWSFLPFGVPYTYRGKIMGSLLLTFLSSFGVESTNYSFFWHPDAMQTLFFDRKKSVHRRLAKPNSRLFKSVSNMRKRPEEFRVMSLFFWPYGIKIAPRKRKETSKVLFP